MHDAVFHAPAAQSSLSSEATQLLGEIEGAVDQAGDNPYQLSILLGSVIDQATSQLSTEEAEIVHAVASVAQSSSEYWEQNMVSAFDALLAVGIDECQGLTQQECEGVLEWATSAPGSPPQWSGIVTLAAAFHEPVPDPSFGGHRIGLPFQPASSARVAQCSGSWPNLKMIARDDVLGGIVGVFFGGLAGIVTGALSGSIASLLGQTLYVLYCLFIL